MQPLFYEHLVPLSKALVLLDNYQFTVEERDQLENMILSMFHHKMIETILSNVPTDAHESIVSAIAEDPHNLEILIYIKSLNPQIEDHIMQSGEELSHELRALLWKTAG